MSEPLQVTQEQLQAILDAINLACVSTYHGYQFTDSDVQSINQQLQTSGIEVDLSIVRVDFADALGGAGGLQNAFQGIEHAIEQGFTNVIKHAFDSSYYPGGVPSSAKFDEVTRDLKAIKDSIDNAAMNAVPPTPANLFNVEQKLDALAMSIDGLAEAAILGTRGEPIPKDKAQRAAKKVYDALQAKPDVYEALMALLAQEHAAEWKAMYEKAEQAALGAKLSPMANVIHDSMQMTAAAPPVNGSDESKLMEELFNTTTMPTK